MQDSQSITPCPACAGASEPIWQLAKVPTQSCRLLREPHVAREFLHGEIELRRCVDCGLVYNGSFLPQTQLLDADYEESQACSAHFNVFARDLIEALNDRFALRGKRVIEVGCGKGSFLAELCALTGASGLGVDPSYDPKRRPRPELSQLRFERDYLHEWHGSYNAELLICRHTLEHIARPTEFMQTLAAVAGDRTPLFIEVPDWQRIAEEGAFWDIYYEHCIYFDQRSLSRVARAAGCTVDNLERGFHDQYLLAYLSAGSDTAPSAPTDEASSVIGDRLRKAVELWQAQLDQWARSSERGVLWGAGSKGVAFLSATAASVEVIPALTDINPHKQGRYLPLTARPVLAPEQLRQLQPEHIIVMNPAYLDEVRGDCRRLGLKAQVISVNQPIS